MMLESIIAFPIPLGKAERTIFKDGHFLIFIRPEHNLPTSSTHSTKSIANRGTKAFGNGRKQKTFAPEPRSHPDQTGAA